MDKVVLAAIGSWSLDPRVIAVLLATAILYVRGWRHLHRVLPQQFAASRLAAFVSGLALLFIALESPLDSFSSLLLSAHMTQHLLLMMVVPPLLLLGQPMLPLLRGLPRSFVKEGLGPFLRWPALQNFGGFLVTPWFAWLAYNVCAIGWHVPALYEFALRSPGWHDVEHACFFWTAMLFWWPVIQPWPSRSHWLRWAMIPYLLAADLVNTAIGGSFVFADKILYPSYAAAPLGGLSPADDQVTAGAIMWVPGSVFYLIPAVVLAMKLISNFRPMRRPVVKHQPVVQAKRVNLIHRFLRWRHARSLLQSASFLAAAAVVVDGLRGPRMAPMNLAGVLPWVYWRGLVVLALIFAGNLFCMACPFMLPRTAARKLLRPTRRWPSFLRSKWLALCLFLAYLWSYEAFSLWSSPAITAWIVIGYFLTAFLVDALFRGASFCKYVCPVGQFNFVSSLLSPLEIKVRKQQTCQSCRTFDCIRGNENHRGCELYLFQPKRTGNFDCTFCLDCVQACPHDNVSLLPIVPGAAVVSDPYRSSIGRFSKRFDIAGLVFVIVFGAFVNALAMIGPFAEATARLMRMLGRPETIGLLTIGGAVIMPAIAVSICAATSRRYTPQNQSLRTIAASFAFALLPLGLGMWAAHLLYHLATGMFTLVPVAERIAGSLFHLSLQPDWSLASRPFLPNWLAPAQIMFLDAGLLLALYLVWRIAKQRMSVNKPFRVFLPWGLLALSLYGAGIWILLQPMQMRGMMMS